MRAGGHTLSATDLLYLAYNRREFTEFSFQTLLDNTNWDLIDHLHVYDDGSEDGTAEYLAEAIEQCPVKSTLHPTAFRSPVRTMNHYVATSRAGKFFKVDNDICVPPGWVDSMLGVMDSSLELELLGTEPGFAELLPEEQEWDGIYRYTRARHIGGVGCFRTRSFTTRRKMEPNGRFGLTEWQWEYRVTCGWIQPDLRVFSLDHLPFEPWVSLAAAYVEAGWARAWSKYFKSNTHLWDWAFPEQQP